MSRMNFGFFAMLIVSMVALTTSTQAQIGTLLPRADALTDEHPFQRFHTEAVQQSAFAQACESSRMIWRLDAECAECDSACKSKSCDSCSQACGNKCPAGECQACSNCPADKLNEQFWEDADSVVHSLQKCECEECGAEACGTQACESAECGTESCTAEACGSAECEAEGCSTCPSCPEDCDSPTDQYCKQMAGLLAVTLNGSQADPAAQRRAIEAALKMVAENAQAQSEAKLAKLELNYEKSLIQLQYQMTASTQDTASVEQLKAWFDPIFVTQQRNVQVIHQLSSDISALKKSLSFMGQKIAKTASSQTRNEVPIFRTPDSDHRFPRSLRSNAAADETAFFKTGYNKTGFVKAGYDTAAYDKAAFEKAAFEKAASDRAKEREIESLRRQIEQLDRQLEVLTKPVQRAGHLAPIYTPDQPLEPLAKGYRK